MTPLEQHPLLGQLLRRVGASPGEPPPLDAWRELLGLMSQICYESDKDRDTLERSIEISSRDMQRLYQDLKRRAESERAEQDAIMRATLESDRSRTRIATSSSARSRSRRATCSGCIRI